MSSHGGAVTEGSPYLESIFPVGMSLQTQGWAATHRAGRTDSALSQLARGSQPPAEKGRALCQGSCSKRRTPWTASKVSAGRAEPADAKPWPGPPKVSVD